MKNVKYTIFSFVLHLFFYTFSDVDSAVLSFLINLSRLLLSFVQHKCIHVCARCGWSSHKTKVFFLFTLPFITLLAVSFNDCSIFWRNCTFVMWPIFQVVLYKFIPNLTIRNNTKIIYKTGTLGYSLIKHCLQKLTIFTENQNYKFIYFFEHFSSISWHFLFSRLFVKLVKMLVNCIALCVRYESCAHLIWNDDIWIVVRLDLKFD